jgi:hypothetical protein
MGGGHELAVPEQGGCRVVIEGRDSENVQRVAPFVRRVGPSLCIARSGEQLGSFEIGFGGIGVLPGCALDA